MSDEKVLLGFWKKDAVIVDGILVSLKPSKDVFVPVRLFSESVSLSFLEFEIKRRVNNFEKVGDEHDTVDNDGCIVSCRCADCETRAGRILELESLLLVVRLECGKK